MIRETASSLSRGAGEETVDLGEDGKTWEQKGSTLSSESDFLDGANGAIVWSRDGDVGSSLKELFCCCECLFKLLSDFI